MLWASLLLFGFSTLLLILSFERRKKLKKQLAEFRENWGQPKKSGHFNFNQIGRYFRHRSEIEKNTFQLIPDSVFTDLNFEAVFEFIDRTTSRIGQQFLYYKLRSVENNIPRLQKFDELSEEFSKNEELRIKAQQELIRLAETETYYFEELIHGAEVKPPTWFPLVYVLTTTMILLGISAIWFPALVLAMLFVFICNLIIHYWNKNNVNAANIALNEYLKTFNAGLSLSKIPELRSHFADLTFFKELEPLNSQMKMFRLNYQVQSDTTMAFYAITELLKISLNAEFLVFFGLIKKVKARKKELNLLFEFIGEVDSALSVASLRAGLPDYCKPSFTEPKKIRVQDMRHPLIPDCVPNSLELEQKSLLLTGSNMSGKTTFIRTLALNMLLGQTIYTCIARSFEAPFSRIYSSIKIADDLLQAKSYYLEEVSIIKDFLEIAADPIPALFILDEIFKGTNTIERIAAGKAVLAYLTKGNHMVLVSTHDVELTELLESQFDLFHFTETVQETDLIFDHKLKPGPLTTRNAIKILEINNFPETVITDANLTAGLFRSQFVKQ